MCNRKATLNEHVVIESKQSNRKASGIKTYFPDESTSHTYGGAMYPKNITNAQSFRTYVSKCIHAVPCASLTGYACHRDAYWSHHGRMYTHTTQMCMQNVVCIDAVSYTAK